MLCCFLIILIINFIQGCFELILKNDIGYVFRYTHARVQINVVL